MVVHTGVGVPLPATPAKLCPHSLPDIHAALTEQVQLRAEIGAPQLGRKEKLGIFLSFCTMLASIEMLAPLVVP